MAILGISDASDLQKEGPRQALAGQRHMPCAPPREVGKMDQAEGTRHRVTQCHKPDTSVLTKARACTDAVKQAAEQGSGHTALLLQGLVDFHWVPWDFHKNNYVALSGHEEG